MTVTYSDKAKRLLSEAESAFAAATTTEVLSEYPYPPVEATWDVSEDSEGHTVFTIQANEPEETARRVLEPDEVKSKHDLRYHLYRLMGDLLRQRSDKLIGWSFKSERRNGQEN